MPRIRDDPAQRLPGSVPVRWAYPRELNLTLEQTRELMEIVLTARDPVATLAALAFLHVRFERVHLFLDGNGRTGRTVLAVQCEKLFGRLPRSSGAGISKDSANRRQ